MSSAFEIISQIISPVDGQVFTTRPAKAVEASYSQYFKQSQVLIDANDPYLVINEYLQDIDREDSGKVTTVITSGKTLFQSLPLVSLQAFSQVPVVHHVELTNFDFSIITSLRDLQFPVLISQNTADLVANTSVAYRLAVGQSTSVFNFVVPFTPSKTVKSFPKVVLEESKEIDDILVAAEVSPFRVLNSKATKNPKDVVVYLGLINADLVSAFSAKNALLVSINVYKPFYLGHLLSIVPASVETLTLVLQTTSASAHFSPLLLDFFQEYSTFQQLKNFTKIVSAYFGYSSNVVASVDNLLTNTRSESPVQNLAFGKVDIELSTKAEKLRLDEAAAAVQNAYSLEEPYTKMLNQVAGAGLTVLNEFNARSLGTESNPEFGFGKFLHYKQSLNQLVQQVYEAIESNSLKTLDNAKLIEYLSSWLDLVKSPSPANHSELVANILNLLESDDSSDTAKQLLAQEHLFQLSSSWLIGSDAWSYDLGASGVHSVIASGDNINMLIIDNEPFDDKKKVNGFRKKDVGLYAMNYGNCYVASVAIYSSYTQVLQAFIEAEKFNGPSIVLAYLPFHSENENTLEILKETKRAVDSGYWPLYRYNPTLSGDQTFKLDSSNLKNQLKDFLARENKLTLLAKKNPELSRNLAITATSESKLQQQKLAADSFNKLLQGLSGPPLTIAFASDGGNAEAVAKKVHRQASGRGLKAVVLAMDDISVEDLPTETNIVFVSSTSGQGEFPLNGKNFWEALKTSVDLDLSSVRFSVFGMGDSEYWPRKEDKHYYNKPGKDLFAKLTLYGGQVLTDIGLGDDQDADGFNTGLNDWMPRLWTALGVDGADAVEEPKPLTNEDMKIGSDFLRGTIAPALKDTSTGAISAVDQQLTKFHGIYMQDDRDIREERKTQGMEPAYSFMVRLRLPGGKSTPEQYLKMDELADVRGNGTIKLTTRATYQLHGIVKHNLKAAIRGMNSALLDTLAACGDVNRNVMVSALPHNAKIHGQVSEVGTLISEYLLPETTAYHEIWLEGEDEHDKAGDRDVWETRKGGPKRKKTMVSGNALVDYEPLYGPTYLPRKFKIVITVPPYNDVDVYAHDVGLIAIVEDNEVIGFNVLAGGGMGTTHNNKKTYPRTGSMLGYISKDKVHFVCEKIMLVQRDFGDRTNRKHARLKYTIDDLGVDVFKGKVEELLGYKLEDPKPFEITSNVDYFGWCKDELGYNHFTAFIENGRIEDTPQLPQKTGLKKVAEFLRGGRSGEFRLTGNQHILISNIEDQDLNHVKALLAQYKLDNTDFSGLRLSSAACVAFPTCGLAMAESERYLPELVSKLEESLEDYGLRHDSVVMRMTGCPNGCARPWVAEVALVGKAFGAYNLMLGGGHHGQRLNKIYRYSIKEDEILDILLPLFKRWSLERHENEPFGDFVIRIGVIKETTEGKYFHDDIPEEA
ncbi:Sulfite reductase [NADPH] subunit beta [Yamadazyma tenuis]|uniref:Sulfite reductase [NADPH] subunit beta n=1 Tax=Candida tenuis (strain ATCC 10573 / BCRC 21748 / CBS 615 / JCM 9827 / NBRC 10315 / NRRL Y-1498 / VKM Y-70) TaxID=590646 RepID=G3BFK8_CANTC|nr:uncharacterized protein CANTEDRAFT_95508 [Yamadazyma tenuis ATCC 10573]EGV60041.1 hypothetical protein CANTEDRAFT_95508 [Yamadazyma tenuis ATCC 10573]WEJ94732.1 Sulfite reductase [NADPH] subunit beta [Yamadazyma tenuis]